MYKDKLAKSPWLARSCFKISARITRWGPKSTAGVSKYKGENDDDCRGRYITKTWSY